MGMRVCELARVRIRDIDSQSLSAQAVNTRRMDAQDFVLATGTCHVARG
jgi:hypothetical protein